METVENEFMPTDPLTGVNVQPHENEVSARVLYWFSQMQNENGLLESTYNSNFVSLYDNSLSALVFIANEDFESAEAIFDFFNSRIDSELLQGTGGFHQFRNAAGAPFGNRWLGDNAWLLIALNNYEYYTGSNAYQNLQNELSNWIRSLQDTDGGILGGVAENGTAIGKVTEGNIDAFNAVLGFDQFHSNLLTFLENQRWNASEKILISWPNNFYEYALDNFPWGYCVFEDFPHSTLAAADMFLCTHNATQNNLSVTGYCFDVDRDAVWLEGTGEMVVAFQKANDISSANYYLQQMEKVLSGSPGLNNTLGLPYAANPGTGYGNDPLWSGAPVDPCISSSAWYALGMLQFDPFEVGYSKNVPAQEKFWLD